MPYILYLDANSMAYAHAAGGAALLDKFAAYAKSEGYQLAITDVVEREIDSHRGGNGPAITKWLTDNRVRVDKTGEASKLKNYLADKLIKLFGVFGASWFKASK